MSRSILRGVQLRDRVAVPPMMQYAGVDGFPTSQEDQDQAVELLAAC